VWQVVHCASKTCWPVLGTTTALASNTASLATGAMRAATAEAVSAWLPGDDLLSRVTNCVSRMITITGMMNAAATTVISCRGVLMADSCSASS